MRTYASEGAAILRYQHQIVAQHVDRARLEDLAGYRVPVVNASSLFSEIAGELSESYPFAAVWFDRDGGIDVSEVAKRFGGGGHFHAAGFEIPAPGRTAADSNVVLAGDPAAT